MILNIDQRKIVDSDVTGNMLIRGVAGSGKTTVAVHRIPILLDYHTKEKDKVLLITYNRSLIHYVNYLYEKMDRQTTLLDLSDKEERLEIKTIDSIIRSLFNQLKIKHKNNPIPSMHEQFNTINYVLDKLQDKYKEIPWFNTQNSRFILNEIDWIKACDYDSIKAYQEADRTGRAAYMKETKDTQGVQRIKKNSIQREAIYECYQFYNNIMYKKGFFDFGDMAKMVKDHFEEINTDKYVHILIDEAQDLSKLQLDIIKRLYDEQDYSSATFITDTSQSIYEKSWLSYHAFTTVGFNMAGRSRILSKNYRTTKQVAMAAYSLTEKDDAITSNELYVKPLVVEREGSFPVYRNFENDEEELNYISSVIKKKSSKYDLRDMVIIARNKKQLEIAKDYLICQGIDSKIYSDKVSFDEEVVKLFTMHSIKGLEFKLVFIIGLNEGIIPYSSPCEADDNNNSEIQDRKLLYVGMTRAEEKLYMTSSGKASKFIKDINPEYLITNDEEPFENITKLPENRYLFTEKIIEIHSKEETVRQGILQNLIDILGYPLSCIDIEVPVQQYSQKGYADIVLYKSQSKEKPLVVIECKAQDVEIEALKDQLFDYMKALPSVRFGMMTNGVKHYFYEKSGMKMLDRAMVPSYDNLVNTIDKVFVYKNMVNNREFKYIVNGYDNKNISIKYMDEEGVLPIGDYRDIGIMGKVSAGLLKTMDQSIDSISRHIPLPSEWFSNSYDYLMLKVDGDSMIQAGIEPRDHVVVRRQADVENYDIAVAVVDDEATMKKIVKMGDSIMLMPENSKYEPIMKKADEIFIAGKIVGVLKSLG